MKLDCSILLHIIFFIDKKTIKMISYIEKHELYVNNCNYYVYSSI